MCEVNVIYFQNLINSYAYNNKEGTSGAVPKPKSQILKVFGCNCEKTTRAALSVIVALGARLILSTPTAVLSGLLAYWLLSYKVEKLFTRNFPPHCNSIIFKYAEIAQVHTYQATSNQNVWKSRGKTVMQQLDAKGACETAARMLAADHGKNIEPGTPDQSAELPNHINLLKAKKMIETSGLSVLFATRDSKIESLAKRIDNLGPAITTISLEDRLHVIIVDKVDKTGAEIRDPYHGWSLRLKREPFQKYINRGGFTLQIAKKSLI